ncbi:hypothetical protein [Treponema sp. SP13]|uniref:hypothetical protein n=1 Tax=Treponema sp. SP13 TaxID=2789742 RepID=UPI003D8A048C
MKKAKMIAFFMSAVLAFSFLGCTNGSDGSDTGNSGGTLPGNDGWTFYKNTAYNIFRLTALEGNYTFDPASERPRFTVTEAPGSSGTVRCALESVNAAKSFDFTGVANLTFQIRGTIDTKALCLAVQEKSDTVFPGRTALSDTIDAISESEWTTVNLALSIPDSDKKQIKYACLLIVSNEWGGVCNTGDWFEIKNLDWTDAAGQSQLLSLVAETGGETGEDPSGSTQWVAVRDIEYLDAAGQSVSLTYSSGASGNPFGDWGAFFADTTHDPIDLQIWQGLSADTPNADDGIKFAIDPGAAWFGAAIVQDPAVGPTDGTCVFYDMSRVAKIRLKVRGGEELQIWAGASDTNASAHLKKQLIDVTTGWKTVEIPITGVAQAYSIFAFGNGKNWMLCKNPAYDIFDIQVWGDGGGTFDFVNKADCSRFTVKTKGSAAGNKWVGGGLVPVETGKVFDFSAVRKMTFEIRGTIDPASLCLGVQARGNELIYPAKAALSTTAALTSLSETNWTTLTFDIARAASLDIINAYMLLISEDFGTFNEGDWFEIKNLDWTDDAGTSVPLTLKDQTPEAPVPEPEGEWVAFKDITYYDAGGNSIALQYDGTPSSDTIGDGWGALFTNRSHNPVDLQVWGKDGSPTFEVKTGSAGINDTYGMVVNILTDSGWYGGAIVENNANPATSSTYYNMSNVKKITLKVKSNKARRIWVGASNKNATDDLGRIYADVGPDAWEEVELQTAFVQRAWTPFAFGGNVVSDAPPPEPTGEWVAFKDITYLAADGTAVALKYKDVNETQVIDTGWGALFTNPDHNPVDLQIYQACSVPSGTAGVNNTYGMVVNITNPTTWFGGAIVQNPGTAAGNSNCIYYDMSAVRKIVFKVKSNKNRKIWAGASNADTADTLAKQTFDVTTDWQTKTMDITGVAQAYAIFGFGGGVGWELCKDPFYDIFNLQIWGGGAGGFGMQQYGGYSRFTVTRYGGGWVGGGLVRQNMSKFFDLTGVKKMTFKIRGKVNTKALCLAVQVSQNEIYPRKNSLYNAGYTSLSETDWTSVTFDVSGAEPKNVINVFMLIFAKDWGGDYAIGDWFEIKDLDWTDDAGNSIKIKYR